MIKRDVKAKYLVLTFCLTFLFCTVCYSFTHEKIAINLFLNGEEKGEAFVLLTHDQDKDILLLAEDVKELGITISGKETVIDEKTYISLRSLSPLVKFELDEKELSLKINAEPEAFEGSTVDLKRREPKGIEYPRQNSAFLNYSIDFGIDERFGFSEFSLPMEIGIRRWDYLLFSNFSYSRQRGGDNKFSRLFTNIVRDDKGSMRRYTAGDFSASTGELGGGAVLGGINISKNYSLNPYFLRYPGINLSGLLYSTSDVELWSDNMILSRQRLTPGKFEFQNIPLTTGVGEAVIVVKDAFGKEQKIVVPFYFSSTLLKEGLHEYSYSAGFIRENLGTENLSYDKPAMLLTHKYGFTDKLTGGLRAEVSKGLVNSGMSTHFVIEGIGFFDTAIAYSFNHTNGYAYSLGYAYNTIGKKLNWRVTLRGHSKGYSNLSLEPDVDRPRTEIIASTGYSSKNLGSITLFYTSSDNYLSNDLKKFTIRYTRRLIKDLNLDISASHSHQDKSSNELFVTLRYIFDRNTSGGVTYQNTDGESGNTAIVQRTPEKERGIGYRLYAEKKEDTPEMYDDELSYHGRYGIYSARYRMSNKIDTYSLRTSGSIAMVNSSLHFGQPVSDSFAVVKVGDLEGVDVYHSSSPVGKTSSKGEVLLNRIQSYDANKIFINDKDLPLGYNLKSFTKHISPCYRSGSFVEFEVEKMQAISGNVFIIEGGEKKPAEFWQLIIDVGGESVGSPVVKDGEFYLENIPAGKHRAIIKKGDKECSFDVVIPVSTEPMINIGEILCEISAIEIALQETKVKAPVAIEMPVQKEAEVSSPQEQLQQEVVEVKPTVTWPVVMVAPEPAITTVPSSVSKLALKPEPAGKGTYSVQLGAFKNKSNAEALTKQYKKKGYRAFIHKGGTFDDEILYRVLIGKFENEIGARKLAKKISGREKIKTIIKSLSSIM